MWMFSGYIESELYYQNILTMLTLTIQPLYERGTEAIGIPQPLDKNLEYTLRKIKGSNGAVHTTCGTYPWAETITNCWPIP